MSEVSVQKATLICGERTLPTGGVDYIVNGLVLPGGRTLLTQTMYSRSRQQHDIALHWPAAMLESLAAYYDRYIREGRREYYDCYTFGAAILGLSGRVAYNERRQPENIQKGQAVRPAHIQNTQLYGLFPWRGGPTHLMIGTQYPDACLHVTGRYDHVAVTSVRDAVREYRGSLYTASVTPLASGQRAVQVAIGQLADG